MKFKFHHTSDFTKILIIAQFFLLSYLLYTLTLSVYKNYEIDRHIKMFNEENTMLAEENLKIASDINYVTSPAYIEKLTKQNRGLVMPGEEVIVVPKVEDEDEALFDLMGNETEIAQNSNFDIWWDFLFGRESNI